MIEAATSAVPRQKESPNREAPAVRGHFGRVENDLDEEVVGRWLAAKPIDRGQLAAASLPQFRIEAEGIFSYAGRIDRPISSWTFDEFPAYIIFLQTPAPWAVRTLMCAAVHPTDDRFWVRCWTAHRAKPSRSSPLSSTG